MRDQELEYLHYQWPSYCVFYNLGFQTAIMISFSTIFIYLD